MTPHLPPPERRCRAMVAGLLDRGVYWAPPRRCGHYARENGFCGQHQPARGEVEQESGAGGAGPGPAGG